MRSPDFLPPWMRGKVKRVPETELRVLIVKAKLGDQNASRVILRNVQNYIIGIVNGYDYEFRADLMQCALIGVSMAIRDFDATRGANFLTHAGWYIRKGISEYMRDHRYAIRLPANVSTRFNQYKRKLKNGRELVNLRNAAEVLGNEKRDNEMEGIYQTVTTVKTIGWQKDKERIKDKESVVRVEFVETVTETEIQAGISAILGQALGEQDLYVLRSRFGLIGGREKTLQDIADEIGISRERVRQIEARAMDRIRRDGKNMAKLAEFR